MVRRRWARYAVAVLAALSVNAAAMVATATPALAACYGSGCNGKDPQVQGCSTDATTIDEFTFGNVHVMLRRSRKCNAAWTKTYSPVAQNALWGQIRGSGLVYVKQVARGNSTTKMITFRLEVRSCVSYWYDNPPVECTPPN